MSKANIFFFTRPSFWARAYAQQEIARNISRVAVFSKDVGFVVKMRKPKNLVRVMIF